MHALSWIGLLVCTGLGWYGAITGMRVGLQGAQAGLLFKPLGAILFLLFGGSSYAAFLLADQELGEPAFVMIPMAMVIPFVMMPWGIFLTCLAVQSASGFLSLKTSQGDLRTYDRGDAAMARKNFAQAIECYRKDLARWKGDTDAVLRLARALEAAGELKMASMELASARLDLLDPTYSAEDGLHRLSTGRPGGELEDRNERLLQITYALGDLYAGPLAEPHRAVMLYEETLQRLYGFKGADPLRTRLKQLKELSLRGEPEEQAGAAKKLTID